MLKWVDCDWDEKPETRPTEPGEYAVIIAGDSEIGEYGHVYYDYDDYRTWATVTATPDGPQVVVDHGEPEDTIIAWYGPIQIPPYQP